MLHLRILIHNRDVAWIKYSMLCVCIAVHRETICYDGQHINGIRYGNFYTIKSYELGH